MLLTFFTVYLHGNIEIQNYFRFIEVFYSVAQIFKFLNSQIIEIFTFIPILDYQSSIYDPSQIFDLTTQQTTRKLNDKFMIRLSCI